MSRLRRELRDLRDGARILRSADFWRAFLAYWSPEAINARLEATIARLERR